MRLVTERYGGAMKTTEWMKAALQTVARALDPENMKRLFLKVINDLRTAVAESTSATGKFFLCIPLGLLCGLLYGAKAVKWFFRIFHKLGTIALTEIAFHTGFLARASTHLRERWSELVDGLISRAVRLWDEVLGAERIAEDKYRGKLWELAREAAIYTACWVPRLVEATLAVGWAVAAVAGLVFVLAVRRSYPGEIVGAALLLVVPPFLQYGIRRSLAKTTVDGGQDGEADYLEIGG